MCCAFSICKGQTTLPKKSFQIFVDSIPLLNNDITVINPDNLDKIVAITTKKHPDGVMYIRLKDHKPATERKLSLAELTDKYIADEDKKLPRIYVMDDTLLLDTTNVRIGEYNSSSIMITNGTEVPYFKVALPNVLIITVSPIKFRLR